MSEKPKPGRILPDLTEPKPQRSFYDLDEPEPTIEDEIEEEIDWRKEWEEYERNLPPVTVKGWEPKSVYSAPRSGRDPRVVSGGLPSLGKKR